MTPVTDANLIAQLEGNNNQNLTPVTDPKLISQLEDNTPQKPLSKTAQEIKNSDMAGIVGFNTAMGRLAHGILQPIAESGIFGDKVTQASKQVAANRENLYKEAETADSLGANLGNLTSLGMQAYALPGGIAGKFITRAITGALSSGLLGGAQYVNDGESRTANAALGAAGGGIGIPILSGLLNKNPYVKAATGATVAGLLGYGNTGSLKDSAAYAAGGAALPFVPGMAGQVGKNLINKLTGNTKDIVNPIEKAIQPAVAQNMLQNINPQEAIATKEAANRLGLNITPAEASGNPIAAAAQGKLGNSKEGAQALYDFGKTRLDQQKQIIRNFLDDVSPDGSPAALNVRGAAQKVLSDKEMALSGAAKPLYQEAYKAQLPQESFDQLINDPVIGKAINNVTNDPIYQRELADVGANSIKTLDYAKRNIDDQIATALRTGEKNRARILTDAKNQLVTTLDKESPTYGAARALYSEGAKPLEQLRNSNIGRLADLPDPQLKNVSKIIFDPGQTDLNVVAQLRDEISKKSPNAWRGIVRNEIERRMDLSNGDYSGSTFFSKILKSDKDFKQFVTATQGMPDVQSKLLDMRAAFKNLINPVTAQTAARLAKSSLDVPRSTMEAVVNHAKNMAGGQYDQAAIKLITSGQWDKEFATISKIKDKNIRAARTAALLGKISANIGTQTINN